MFPNPQEALPLPPYPNLEQYKKRAKDLVKACKADGPDGINTWAAEWMQALAASRREAGTLDDPREVDQYARKISEFARSRLKNDRKTGCALADAQFVIARVQGFMSWPKFASHLKALASESSDESAFEAAADAIVDGDAPKLQRLLRNHPRLIRARSPREHRAMLLHYVSANGVENYRQRTPKNAVEIAETLLSAGAEVKADADVYGGGATTLGLVATSCHPHNAGVQNALIDVLVKHGAPLDDPQGAGNKHNLVNGCLANGRGHAAEYLAHLGAPLDLEGAAGIGRLDIVERFFDEHGRLTSGATPKQMRRWIFICLWVQANQRRPIPSRHGHGREGEVAVSRTNWNARGGFCGRCRDGQAAFGKRFRCSRNGRHVAHDTTDVGTLCME